MNAQVLFDQFSYADRLKRGGFSEEQARASTEALGAALSQAVATKPDLTQLGSALKKWLCGNSQAVRAWWPRLADPVSEANPYAKEFRLAVLFQSAYRTP
jgi:hypothetical protein